MANNNPTDNPFVAQLNATLDQHLNDEKFGVEELVRELGVSRTQLHRKLQQHTGKTASQVIREARLKKGKQLLEQSELSVAEIAYRVGFNSATYFNTCFTELYGYTPGEVKNNKRDIAKEKRLDYKKFAFPAIVAFAVLAVYSISGFFNNEPDETISIAVLPFRNDSPDSNNEYFCWGIMESIIDNLTKVHGFDKVISRISVEKYQGTTKDASSIASELGVSHLLTGSVRKQGDDVRIIVNLIDALRNDNIWSQPFEGNAEDAMQLESKIALQVIEQLKVQLSFREETQIKVNEEVDFEIYDLHLRAKEYLRNASRSNLAFLDSAALTARKILERDPNFLPAYKTLFDCFFSQVTWEYELHRPPQLIDSMKSTLKIMEKIDPTARDYFLMEAEYLQERQFTEEAANIYLELLDDHPYSLELLKKLSHTYRIQNSAKSIRLQFQALRLAPNLVEDKFFIRDLGMKYIRIDYLDRAVAIANYLTNNYPDYIEGWNMLFEISALRRDFTGSEQYADSLCTRDATSSYCMKANLINLANKGQYDHMIAYLKEIEQNKYQLKRARYHYLLTSFYPYALYKAGYDQYDEKAKELARIYEEGIPEQSYQKHYNYWFLAQNHACDESKDKCLEYLKEMEQEINKGHYFYTRMKYFPNLDPVRDEPEFIDLLDRVEKQRTVWREQVIQWEQEGIIEPLFVDQNL